MGVGHLDAEALEKPLIDGIEEGLLLVEIAEGGGGVFDGAVEVFEASAEVVPAERAGGQGGNDLLDFLGNDVALDEVGDVEDLPEDAFGEDVLDDHLLDGLDRDVRVERAAAKGAEILEGGDELLVGLALLLDQVFEAGADLGDLVPEFLDRLFPVRHGRGRKLEEELEDIDQLFVVGEVGFIDALGILVKDGAIGLPEEDVLLRVAEAELDLDLLFEVVGGVFGFPDAVVEAVVVEQGTVGFCVGLALALDGVFGDERPIELAGAGFEQLLEGAADGGLVLDAELGEIGQGLVVKGDWFMGWLQLEAGHGHVMLYARTKHKAKAPRGKNSEDGQRPGRENAAEPTVVNSDSFALRAPMCLQAGSLKPSHRRP